MNTDLVGPLHASRFDRFSRRGHGCHFPPYWFCKVLETIRGQGKVTPVGLMSDGPFSPNGVYSLLNRGCNEKVAEDIIDRVREARSSARI